MDLPPFWQWVGDDAASPILPRIPDVRQAVHRPRVLELVRPFADTVRDCNARCTPPRVVSDETDFLVGCLYDVIQSLGAELATAMDAGDLKAASASVRELAELLEACGGGTICAVHEPYLLSYLEAVSRLGDMP